MIRYAYCHIVFFFFFFPNCGIVFRFCLDALFIPIPFLSLSFIVVWLFAILLHPSFF